MNIATRICVAATLLAAGLSSEAWAASNPAATPLHYNGVYYDPPTWASMVMVNITFDGHNLSWEPASYDFTVGPILRAAPANGANPAFAPTQPWSVLNGTAFNRQLGWYDNVFDDFYDVHQHPANYGLTGQTPLPSAYRVWIDQLASSSPELKTYAVSEALVSTGPYTPIFGTAGSSTKWLWDGFMDHNAYAVNLQDFKAPNQVLTGNYKLYIGDASGNEIVNANQTPVYGSTTITWQWIGPATLPAFVAGDANGDGIVSFKDYIVLESHFGRSNAIFSQGDFNRDGVITFKDYIVLEANFGKSSSVPEPATIGLLLVGACGVVRSRRN